MPVAGGSPRSAAALSRSRSSSRSEPMRRSATCRSIGCAGASCRRPVESQARASYHQPMRAHAPCRQLAPSGRVSKLGAGQSATIERVSSVTFGQPRRRQEDQTAVRSRYRLGGRRMAHAGADGQASDRDLQAQVGRGPARSRLGRRFARRVHQDRKARASSRQWLPQGEC